MTSPITKCVQNFSYKIIKANTINLITYYIQNKVQKKTFIPLFRSNKTLLTNMMSPHL